MQKAAGYALTQLQAELADGNSTFLSLRRGGPGAGTCSFGDRQCDMQFFGTFLTHNINHAGTVFLFFRSQMPKEWGAGRRLTPGGWQGQDPLPHQGWMSRPRAKQEGWLRRTWSVGVRRRTCWQHGMVGAQAAGEQADERCCLGAPPTDDFNAENDKVATPRADKLRVRPLLASAGVPACSGALRRRDSAEDVRGETSVVSTATWSGRPGIRALYRIDDGTMCNAPVFL